MRSLAVVLLLVFSAACASAPLQSGGSRGQLWRQAHAALYVGNFQVAEAAFQRLATEFPRSPEGREAQYYLGVLHLNSDNPGMNLRMAEQNLSVYLALDSTFPNEQRHRPEALSLLTLTRELLRTCADPTGKLQCAATTSTVVVERPPTGAPATPTASAEAAEIARLRRQVGERDETIRQLREELQRIRNTLAPPPRP